MSVTKSNGSLQILQARFTRSQARKTTEGHEVYSPRTLSAPPSVCLFFFFWDCSAADIKFPDFSIFKEGPLILMTMLWGGTTLRQPHREWLLRPDGEQSYEKEKGVKLAAKNSGTVWNYSVTSSLLSLPLWSLFSLPLICMSVSPPAVLSFCHQHLHFEPSSINGSGKLQMFRVNYVNYREKEGKKTVKSMESSLYFIIHHTPTSSQNKLDLLSSPAHSGSKSSEICSRILITLCLHQNEKSNTHTHACMETFFFLERGQYIASLMDALSPTFQHVSLREAEQ